MDEMKEPIRTKGLAKYCTSLGIPVIVHENVPCKADNSSEEVSTVINISYGSTHSINILINSIIGLF